MPTNQFPVFGENHIAFHNTGTHPCGGLVRLFRMLGKLHRGTTMTDAEVC